MNNQFLWDDFVASEEVSKKKISVIEYPTVHRDDHEAITVVSPNLKKGPWIAGGACLRWYQNQPVEESDIDVFCADAKQAADVIQRVKDTGRFTTKYESSNATTFGYWSQDSSKQWTIQIITRRFFDDINAVIRSFDITVCEIGTCGNEWVLGPFTAKDIREKNLNFKLPLQADAVKRLTKYWTYGYRPVEGTVELIANNPNSKWQYTVEEDYQNAF